MEPIEMVLAVLPGLSDGDRKKVATALGQPPQYDPRPPCQRNGHKFKKMVVRDPMWCGLVAGTVTLVCEACGEAITRETGR
jgi:hypothetical protein